MGDIRDFTPRSGLFPGLFNARPLAVSNHPYGVVCNPRRLVSRDKDLPFACRSRQPYPSIRSLAGYGVVQFIHGRAAPGTRPFPTPITTA